MEESTQFKKLRAAVIKLTSRCNIQCDYCYESITFGNVDHYFMHPNTFKQVIDTLLTQSEESKFLVILHGGEPTLLSTNWFDECLSYARNKGEALSKEISISMQTNLVNIPNEKLECFKQHNICLGVSLDNPDYVIKSMRPFAKKVMHNFLRARNLGIQCGVLLTINKSNIHLFEETCHWLYEKLKIYEFKANVAYSVGQGLDQIPLTSEEVFNAKKTIIDYMLNTNGQKLIEYNLTNDLINFVEMYIYGRPGSDSLCDKLVCGAGKEVVGISPSGNILPCGRFAWNDTDHILGSIFEPNSYQNDDYYERLHKFQGISPKNWVNCHSCEAKPVCNYGCQAFIARTTEQINIECLPTKAKFHYLKSIQDRIKTVYPLLKLRRNNTLAKKFFELNDYSDFPYKDELIMIMKYLAILQDELTINKNLTNDELNKIMVYIEELFSGKIDLKNAIINQELSSYLI